MRVRVAVSAGLALLIATASAAPAAAQVRADLGAPLMSSDGVRDAPVVLESAAVLIEPLGGSVRTTLDMTFRNPSARTLEGNLDFPLEPGQQVAGFALDIAGHMRAAVPVEKQRGRQVLEAIERRGADPGLLEQTAGNHFRLRVYPFMPHATRSVRVVLSETPAPGQVVIRIPTAFAAGLARVPVTVLAADPPRIEGALAPMRFSRAAAGRYVATLREADLGRGRAIRIALGTADLTRPRVHVQDLKGSRYFTADLPVSIAPVPRALPQRIVLLWDASASGGARAHDLELALLDAYFKHARSVRVDLVRFRDVAETPIPFTVADGDWRALRAALESTVYDGATSLRGWTPSRGAADVLLVGDGMFNYADTAFPSLEAGQRLYAIRAGVAGDATRLSALAEAHGGLAIILTGVGDLPAGERALLQDQPRVTGFDAVGATDVVAESTVARDGWIRVAGRLTDPAARVMVDIAGGGKSERVALPLRSAVEGEAAASLWAKYTVDRLMADPTGNRAAIAAIGARFGVVTPGSSLIVLDDVADYLRYSIAPPDELKTEYDALARQRAGERLQARAEQLAGVRAQWAERIDWWTRVFPKGAPPTAKQEARPQSSPPMPPPAPMAAPAAMADARAAESASLDRIEVTGSRVMRDTDRVAGIATKLQPWTPHSPLARRLRLLDADAAYRAYLDEREHAAPGTAFYLDVADVLFDRKRDDLALRVLSNLAEMDLDNRHVLRVLGYRLMQANRPDLAVPVLEQVLAMSDDEPQSYRDLAHAFAALGNRQKAVDLLYEVVTGTWDRRFPDIEVIALAEINALVSTSDTRIDTHRIAPDLLRNLPLDLRVVLSWDADNSDMDLWVTDPNGEKAFYSNRLTYQGGHMSHDFTGGYGPEEFALRTAKPGRYKVEANYYGDRQQLVTGATTLQLWLSTRFGTSRQNDQRVTLRLRDAKETVLVGEFEVR